MVVAAGARGLARLSPHCLSRRARDVGRSPARDRASRGTPPGAARAQRNRGRRGARPSRCSTKPRAGLASSSASRNAAGALAPEAEGVTASLGRIAIAVHSTMADGSWERLKACRAPDASGRSSIRPRTLTGLVLDELVQQPHEKARAFRERHRHSEPELEVARVGYRVLAIRPDLAEAEASDKALALRPSRASCRALGRDSRARARPGLLFPRGWGRGRGRDAPGGRRAASARSAVASTRRSAVQPVEASRPPGRAEGRRSEGHTRRGVTRAPRREALEAEVEAEGLGVLEEERAHVCGRRVALDLGCHVLMFAAFVLNGGGRKSHWCHRPSAGRIKPLHFRHKAVTDMS